MKSGFVSIIGRPNAGKSTLLNSIMGEKIAAISDKPQTTRNNITGILTKEDFQIVFIDTPGIHFPRNKLGEFMVKEAQQSYESVEVVVLVADIEAGETENDKIIENIKNLNVPVILAINKIDRNPKEKVLELIKFYTDKMNFDAVVPISAKSGDGVEILLNEIVSRLKEGPMYYPDDEITDQTQRQLAAEIIREKTLLCLSDEVPHGVAVEVLAYKLNEKGILEINAVIYCEKKSHKGIIVGKGGNMIKKIGRLSRIDIEQMTDTKVFLELWVKIKEDWRNSDNMLKEFGYKSN